VASLRFHFTLPQGMVPYPFAAVAKEWETTEASPVFAFALPVSAPSRHKRVPLSPRAVQISKTLLEKIESRRPLEAIRRAI
jgi:hypothetical protein